MQVVVKAFAVVMTRLMGASGAESVNVAASIFMGQTEAPLTVRPFLGGMTQSELLCVMTSGMAHVSAGIMGAYIFRGVEAQHLLAAVLMTAPGTILLAKIVIPETGSPQTMGTVKVDMPRSDVNIIGAAARGTSDGLHLALNVAAMLISFLALVALVNLVLGHIGNWFHVQLSLEKILGVLFAPLALAMGVPWKDAFAIGDLLGTRMVLNELIAYTRLGPMQATLDPRSFTIATYALCGFANFGSVGIQIGGIGALIPERRNDLARLGLRALLAGTLANFVSASIAGMLL
jgi:CNT family concentrative nucleoside transporter